MPTSLNPSPPQGSGNLCEEETERWWTTPRKLSSTRKRVGAQELTETVATHTRHGATQPGGFQQPTGDCCGQTRASAEPLQNIHKHGQNKPAFYFNYLVSLGKKNEKITLYQMYIHERTV